MFNPQSGYGIEEVWYGGSRVRKHFNPRSLRPGGTIAGTTLMTLADFAPYVAILATIGWVPLAVTTNLSINFLRKPEPGDLFAEARLIKLGQTAGGCRDRHPIRGPGRLGGPRDVDVFNPAVRG